MTLRYSERLRTNVVVIAQDEFPSFDEVVQQAQMHTASRKCCGGRTKYAIALDTESGPAREQFIQHGSLDRLLGQRYRKAHK